jgi:hypothetical protein
VSAKPLKAVALKRLFSDRSDFQKRLTVETIGESPTEASALQHACKNNAYPMDRRALFCGAAIIADTVEMEPLLFVQNPHGQGAQGGITLSGYRRHCRNTAWENGGGLPQDRLLHSHDEQERKRCVQTSRVFQPIPPTCIPGG